MEPDSPAQGRGNWALYLGPGARMESLSPVLEGLALSGEHSNAHSPRFFSWDGDPSEQGSGAWRLVLDTDTFPIEDVGLIRRSVQDHPGGVLILTGRESRTQAAIALLALPATRWLPWPLDIEQIAGLLDPPKVPMHAPETSVGTGAPLEDAGSWTGEGPAPWSKPTTGQDSDGFDEKPRSIQELRELEDDLQAIEQILANGPMAFPGPEEEGEEQLVGLQDPRGLELSPEEIEAFFEPQPEELDFDPPGQSRLDQAALAGPALAEEQAPPATESHPTPDRSHAGEPNGPTSWTPPTWYKDQIADLADWAQRLTIAGGTEGLQDQALAQDVFGLTQFARTLGYLAAPPAQGTQEIGLATVLEELLAGLAGARDGSPRYLFRPQPGAIVRSDKTLLCTSLDALLHLADACSGPEDVVRVSLETNLEAGGHLIQIRFPAGPLGQLPVDQVLAPYALRRLVPQIGPNALAAAGRILQGQGGDLAIGLGEDPDQRILQVTLPLA